jgi:4-amino-4-deoxy-L-arabinose transferase
MGTTGLGLWVPSLTLVGAAICFVLAGFFFLRQRPSLALAWLLLASLGLRLYPAFDGFLHSWDERYHALVARNLMEHPLRPTLYETPLLPYDYRDWQGNHVWLHKPPLALWLMAAAMKLFGSSEVALRLPSLLLSVATTWAVYLLGRAWKGEAVGLLAAGFQSVNAFLVLLAAGWFATDHVDTAVVGFVTLSVAAGVLLGPSLRGFAVAGVLAGLAVLSKSWSGLLPLAVLCIWYRDRLEPRQLLRGLALGLGICFALALPWWLYTARAFPLEAAWESSYSWRHLSEPLEGHGRPFLFHVARLPRIYGELIYVPLIWFGVQIVRNTDSRGRALAAWIAVPYAVFSLAATKMPAYVMVAAPAVFLVQAAFCVWLAERLRGSRVRRFLLGLVIAAVAGLPVRILLNDLRLFREHDRHPAWVEELRALGTRLEGKPAVIFGSPRPIETMFYTAHTAYEAVPDRKTLQSLQAQGHLVVVYRSPDLQEDVRRLPGLVFVDP